jgi:hypothetical protein
MPARLFSRTLVAARGANRLSVPRASRSLTHSSVVGALEPPLDERTLPEYFQTRLLPSFADKPALVCRSEVERPFGGPSQAHGGSYLRWTFAELDGHVAALARGLRGMGVQKGDRVAVIMGNNRCSSAVSLARTACSRSAARTRPCNGLVLGLGPF